MNFWQIQIEHIIHPDSVRPSQTQFGEKHGEIYRKNEVQSILPW